MTSFTSKALLSKLRKVMTKNGFTLIEVMAVVAITGILSAVGLPSFTKELNKAKDSATIATLTDAAKECSLSLITKGDDSNYLDLTTNKPFYAKFGNIAGTCAMNGKLTLVSPGRTVDTTNNTHIAEVTFDGDVPQTAKFLTELN